VVDSGRDRMRKVLSRWGFHDLFTSSEEADQLMAELEDAISTAAGDDGKLDNSGIPVWFTTLEKFKFGDNDGDGTLEMGIVEDEHDEHGTFVRFVEAGDNLADLMRAAWTEENPIILKKRLGDAEGT